MEEMDARIHYSFESLASGVLKELNHSCSHLNSMCNVLWVLISSEGIIFISSWQIFLNFTSPNGPVSQGCILEPLSVTIRTGPLASRKSAPAWGTDLSVP